MAGGKLVKVKTRAEFKKWMSPDGPSQKLIVDFFASWCPPCRMMGPVFEELSKKYANQGVTFLKVDVDEVRTVAQKAGVKSMPTFQIYYKGQLVDSAVGADQDKLEDLVKKIIAVGEDEEGEQNAANEVNEQETGSKNKKPFWKAIFGPRT